MAAMLGPQFVTYIAAYQKAHGVPKSEAYNVTLYIIAGIRLVGLVCNLCVKAMDSKLHEPETDNPAQA